jgi:hypothetical protein
MIFGDINNNPGDTMAAFQCLDMEYLMLMKIRTLRHLIDPDTLPTEEVLWLKQHLKQKIGTLMYSVKEKEGKI